MPARRREVGAVARRGDAAALAVAAAALAALGGSAAEARPAAEHAVASCAGPRLADGYVTRVTRGLRARRDVWGEALIASPAGPTYAGARRFLHPLLLARAPRKRRLTRSGVHYAAFGWPSGAGGTSAVALHVADGGQILARRVGGRSLDVLVGRSGIERYGSCLARLGGPSLGDGWLPILRTRYRDRAGVRYEQESFATRSPQAGRLVSYLRLTADARGARTGATIALRPSGRGLRRSGNTLRRGGTAELAFAPGASFARRSVRYRVARGTTRTVFAVWRSSARPGPLPDATEAGHDTARTGLAAYWERRLREGAQIEVPERRVTDALRGLLVQNLTLTWRYSVGNPYEQFSFPEGTDVARVIGELGYPEVERAIVETSFGRRPQPYANWKRGQKLVGAAAYYRRSRDRAFVARATPTLRRYVDALGRQIAASRTGLLARERYSSDIPDSVLGLHSQAVAWQGLTWMASVWREVGQASLARRTRRLADRLERGLRRAVSRSQRRLADRSLFLPAQLLDGERAYASLTEARLGSYWNLVMPYALASGLFRPGSPQAEGALRYLLRHGSRLLGLVRAGAYALYREPVHPVSGTDHVYGINAARFLADLDEPDQLVLSLYGALAAGMAPGTHVSGEAASVAPLEGAFHRAMYLPPNSASNAATLATLRAMLVHERRDAAGEPRGLELAFATPRAWLRPGRRIAVAAMPTSFGPVSYELEAQAAEVRAVVEVPRRSSPRTLKLRLRLPPGRRIGGVTLAGRPFGRLSRATQTLDLSRLSGRLELVVRHA